MKTREWLLCAKVMNAVKLKVMNAVKLDEEPDDALFRIERKIAQRADELSQQPGVDRRVALEYWQQAEREVWESAEVPRESARPRGLATS